MSLNVLAKYLNARQKQALKARFSEVRNRLMRTLFRYDADKLKRSLATIGINATDTLLVHANFGPDSGFQGTPLELASAFAEVVGDKGNLLMVSIPFRGGAYDYLTLGKPFNVKKTISMMGLVTEMFRRREGTLRSLHPTHPVLAYGKDARWLTEGHEGCLYPCGRGTPFEKFHRLKGKILFFDVPFRSITFFHYVEDLLRDRLPFPVYSERLFSVPVVDAKGDSRVVQTYAFNSSVRRMAEKLESEMERQAKVRHGRVGNSRFRLVTAEDVVACFAAMVESGNLPYEFATGGRQPDDE